ncbi:MAG: hypothetical protein ABI467_11330 [Kofleriaceae bacterium]
MTHKPKKPAPISLRAYARHRDCAVESVRGAISGGRLAESIVLVDGMPKITDVELADREWAANTRAKVDTGPEVDVGYRENRARREAAAADRERSEADLSAIKLRRLAGTLVDVTDIEARLTTTFGNCRNKLLGIPTRCRQRDPGFTDAQIQLIEELVHESLEDLAGPAKGKP